MAKKISYNEWQKRKRGGRKTPLEIFLWCLFVLFAVLTVLRFFWENPVAGHVLSIMQRICVATFCVAGYFYFEKNSEGKVLSACSYFGCAVLLLSELFIPLIIVYKIRLYYHSAVCVLFLIRFIRWKEGDGKKTPGFLGFAISATEAIRVMFYIDRYEVLSRNFLIFIGVGCGIGVLAFIPILLYAIKAAKKSTATYDRKGDIPVIIGVFLVFLLIGNLFVFAGNVKAVDKQAATVVLPVERLSSGGSARSPRRFYVKVEYEGEELSLTVSRAEYLQLKVGDEVVMEIHRGNFGVYYYAYAGQAESSTLPD